MEQRTGWTSPLFLLLQQLHSPETPHGQLNHDLFHLPETIAILGAKVPSAPWLVVLGPAPASLPAALSEPPHRSPFLKDSQRREANVSESGSAMSAGSLPRFLH